MALIPADVGLRMRLDNELLPQQITPVQEVAAELPRLQAGQLFTAQIREVLPQNTYLALVAGKQVTLSLPENVKSGDVLELVVVDQTPKTIIAELASPPPTVAGETATPQTTLSQTGQMLRSLLVNEGEMPEAAPLNRGQPLLERPPQNGAELAPVLSKAVASSGLFYEAHQAQWVAGKLPLANLLQEPQGQQPAPAPLAPPAAQQPPAAVTTPTLAAALATTPLPTPGQAAPAAVAPPLPGVTNAAGAAAAPQAPGSTAQPTLQAAPQPAAGTGVQTPAPPINNAVAHGLMLYEANQAQQFNGAETHLPNAPVAAGTDATASAPARETATTGTATATATATPTAAPALHHEEARDATRLQTGTTNLQMQPMPTVPDDLRALVQQQLDAAGTQRLLWHGEIWPGQTMQWQLEWQQGSTGGGEEEPEPWQTKLRLTTPRLGTLEASLQLGAAGVRVALSAADAGSAAEMRAAAPDLESALAAAGVPLRGFAVKQAPEDEK